MVLQRKRINYRIMGKKKYIETPEILWQHFLDYKEYVKKRPFLIKDWVGKDADEVHKEKERPLTIEGFENYLEDKEVISHLSDYFANTNGNYSDYSTICSRIKRNVRQDQIEGGMVGIYNPSITQRLNGLVDKKEVEHNLPERLPIFGDNPLDDK
jgi:hypothetical protein